MKKGWLTGSLWDDDGNQTTQVVTIDAPIAKVSPVVVRTLKAGKQTLTAVVFKDGKLETVSGADAASEEELTTLAVRAEKEGEKAVTVKRPTPCCPDCIAGAVAPASEVLLEFLDAQQHADWAHHRAFVVLGGTTGHRYLIAHRHSRYAQIRSRICYDLDDGAVMHFHDWSVPPEEECLAAKLVLEHREAWLRNAATLFDAARATDVLRNPFGDVNDGRPDAFLTNLLAGFMTTVMPQVGLDPSKIGAHP